MIIVIVMFTICCVYSIFTMCVLHVSEMVKVLIYTDMVVALRQQRYFILEGSPICFMNKKSWLLCHLKLLYYIVLYSLNEIK